MPHVWVGLVIATLLWISNAIVISHSDGSLFSDLNATASEDSSPLNTSLRVPLIPTPDMGFWVKVRATDTRAGPFKEISLVACTVAIIARFSWSGPENVPITAPKTEKRCKGILFSIEPTLLPGAELTTYKAGIAFIVMLRNLFVLPVWPRGHLTIEIAKYDPAKEPQPWGLPIGVIYVENLAPEVGSTVNSTASNDNDVIPSISSKSEISYDTSAGNSTHDGLLSADSKTTRERKWLACYIQLVRYMFAKAYDSRVSEILPPGHAPHMFPMVLHLRSDVDDEMEAVLAILRDPGSMIWLSVLGAAMHLCEIAAANGRWEYEEAIRVAHEGVKSVRLAIGRRAR